jgi:dienelactone hydrolase
MAIVSEPAPYRDGALSLTGQVYRDDSLTGPRPGILMVHGAGGLDGHITDQGARYVSLGYVVFAADMFGPGVAGPGVASDREKAMKAIAELRGAPDALIARARAGLAELERLPDSDGRHAAVGFCFGGTTVITTARHGLPLAGVVSMHGALATVRPALPDSMHVPLLACHGADDPHVPMSDVVAFAEEMRLAGADWQLNAYGGAVHGFTHKHAVPGGGGIAYHEPTDRRSFAAARSFLTEVFENAAAR